MRKVSSLIMVGVVFTAMFLQGCKITFNKADFGKAIVEDSNLKVLTYDENSYTSYGENIYYFLVDPANDSALGDDIKEVYDVANDLLSQDEYKDEKIELFIGYKSIRPNATASICVMTNYDPKTKSKGYSHIVQMGVVGIKDEYPYYDDNKDYEVNNLDYWTYFEDIDIHFDDFITYKNACVKLAPEAEALSENLRDKFGDILSFNDMYVYENAVHTSRIELPVIFNENNINQAGDYPATINFIETVRFEINSYLKQNPDSELLKYRIKIIFNRVSDEPWGAFSNFLNDGEYTQLEEFASVDYYNVTVDEMLNCTGILQINVSKWNYDDAMTVIENMSGLKVVYGIQYTGGVTEEKKKEIEAAYPDILFVT